jgi:hypothetical protein
MGKDLDRWPKIAALIDRDKAAALKEFHEHEFNPARQPAPRTVPMPARRPWFFAVASALIATAALASFWVLNRSWQSTPAGSLEAAGLLDNTFLYAKGGSLSAEDMTHSGSRPSSPLFTAWAAAGLARAAATPEEPVDPSAPVERVDPGEVRQKIGKVIRENTLEHLLTQFKKIHDKEA